MKRNGVVFACFTSALLLSPVAYADDPILVMDTGGHTSPVHSLTFTADSRFLVSAGDDKVVRVWDVAKGGAVRTFRGQIGSGTQGMIYAVALSPDQRFLAVAGLLPGYGIRIHDFHTGEVTAVLNGHVNGIECLAYSPDGAYLASGDSGGFVRTWDARRMSSVKEIRAHNRVHTVAFSPDSKRLVSGGFDKMIRIWNPANGKLLAENGGQAAIVVSAVFSPDGRTLATVSQDGMLVLHDPITAAPVQTVEKALLRPANLSFTPDGTRLLTTSMSNGRALAQIYSLAERTFTTSFRQHDSTIIATAVSPDGRFAATAGAGPNDVYVWDLATGSPISKLAGKGQPVSMVAFAKDGNSILFGNKKLAASDVNAYGTLSKRIWLRPQAGLDDRNHSDAFRVQWGGEIKPDGSEITFVDHLQDQVLKAVPGPSGESAAVLQVRRGEQVVKQFVRDETSGYRHLCYTFTHDGRVISGGVNGKLLLYSNPDQRPIEFRGHTASISSVAVSPDNRTLLSGSEDQTIRLWDIETGRNLLTVFVASDDEWVAWTPEGYYSSSFYGERYVGWHVNQGEQKAAKYFSVARFRKEFDRPDIVAQQLQLHDIARAVRSANATMGVPESAPIAPADVAAILPPEVHLVAPDEDNATVQSENYTVRALVFSTTLPIQQTVVFINGSQAPGGALPGHAQSQDVKLDVHLERGANTITVKAINAKGIWAEQSKKIQCECGTTAQRKPNLIFLAIGISSYQIPGISLNYAHLDAEQIRDAFLKQKNGALFGDVQAEILTNKDATRLAIIDKLEWFKRAGMPGDVRILFVAGHGEVWGPRNDYYFCANAHDPQKSPELFDIRGSILVDALTFLPGKAVLMLDTCHAAAASGKRGIAPLDMDTVLAQFKGASGIALFAAAMGTESSIESVEWKHGAFTKAILDGLGGKVRGEKGIVKTSDLGNWLEKQVPDMTQRQQHPRLIYIPEQDLLPFPIFGYGR